MGTVDSDRVRYASNSHRKHKNVRRFARVGVCRNFLLRSTTSISRMIQNQSSTEIQTRTSRTNLERASVTLWRAGVEKGEGQVGRRTFSIRWSGDEGEIKARRRKKTDRRRKREQKRIKGFVCRTQQSEKKQHGQRPRNMNCHSKSAEWSKNRQQRKGK